MNNIINTQPSDRNYGIIYSSDYLNILSLLKEDIRRRGYSLTSDPTSKISEDKINLASNIDDIIAGAKILGYSTSETYDIITASQMLRIETFIKQKAKEILVN